MRSVLLMLMLSITHDQSLSSCPASCVVCSGDAVICHKLSNIIEAPETTKALMLTDGAIVSVDRHFLSDMSNMTVLSLSHNAIATLTHDAFQNLTILHTLLLDHNRLSSQALERATFSWLPRLEILQLGNNVLGEVKGSWFHAARALRTLQLGGNRLTRLDTTTFASADLRGLETLDLSDNLITYLGRDSFRGLPGLRSLDLSRNQLQKALPEAFSYLSWLTSLNLELNRWNCTCELRELASFLTSYMEAPDKVLFNGRRMVCVSADNPAVKTVLELTEANCVPPNQNITVQVEAKNSVSPQRYARDLALAAAFCFAGGVGLTLAVVYIFHHKLETNKRDRTGAEEEENRRTAPTQTVPQWDLSRENQALHLAQMGLETKLMLLNSNQQGSHLQPWEREKAMYDLRMGKDGCHFTCPHCGPALTGSAVEQGGGVGHIDAALDMLRQGGAQPNKMESLAMTEERDERSRHVPPQALISKMKDLRGQRPFNRRPEGTSETILPFPTDGHMLDFLVQTGDIRERDALHATWYHHANMSEMNKALQKADVTIQGHNTVNVTTTLGQWLDAVLQSKKGIKLDFKSIQAVSPSLDILSMTNPTTGINRPVWLNTDILSGPNVPAFWPVVNGSEFLALIQQKFPDVTISPGWAVLYMPLFSKVTYT
ncbi:hypothetical protein J4Q44_G00185960 [Coregonus suidteri]|uniref:Menorin-like domain-containing protein n=1 Tax=Coregonus suidteri TaxID=861788 RepID=A0AAN8LU65_9TELE